MKSYYESGSRYKQEASEEARKKYQRGGFGKVGDIKAIKAHAEANAKNDPPKSASDENTSTKEKVSTGRQEQIRRKLKESGAD